MKHRECKSDSPLQAKDKKLLRTQKRIRKKIERKRKAAIAKVEKRREKAEKRAKAKESREIPTILTPREQAMLEKRKERKIAFAVRFTVGLIIYCGLLGLIAGAVFVSIWMTKRSETAVVTTRVTLEEEEKSSRLKVITQNGTPYLSVSFLSPYGEMIETGDYAARTIRFTDSGDYAVFRINSAVCEVNGVDIHMEDPVLLIDGELYMPLRFYTTYLTGIRVNAVGSRYEITPGVSELGYKIKQPTETTKVPEEEAGSLLEFANKVPEFKSDLSAYERYMNPGEGPEYLALVNGTHAISETYRPSDLTGVEDQNAAYPGGDYHAKLCLPAAKSLDAMLQEARAYGHSGLQATSGYRSYAEQRYRFNTLVTSIMASSGASQAAAEEEASKNVHMPGFSEYQTGLCADVRFPGEDMDAFGGTEAAKWLQDNCYKFGFILRYPADKTASTGMDAQPWHFRYVGRYHATRIKFLNMSLEEYTDFMGLESAK